MEMLLLENKSVTHKLDLFTTFANTIQTTQR